MKPKLLAAADETSWQPAAVCIVGCGLIGMSLALALRAAYPQMRLVGVDIRADHRAIAQSRNTFDVVLSALPAESFPLLVLAIPPRAAAQLMGEAGQHARFVMDVCSIKLPLCAAATEAGMADQFAPSHPMAGIAAEGPTQATADLFLNHPWILFRAWPACTRLEPLVRAVGARVVWLADAASHDVAMAAVSHGIHVTSLSAMLAYEETQQTSGATLANITGPGFRDITRLADSPSEFWTDTLLLNATAVTAQIDAVIAALQRFRGALTSADEDQLRGLLDEARQARWRWRTRHDESF